MLSAQFDSQQKIASKGIMLAADNSYLCLQGSCRSCCTLSFSYRKDEQMIHELNRSLE